VYTGEVRPQGLLGDTLALRVQPDQAFGDGSHPTTRLCAGAVDVMCRLHQPQTVLDVGTGTGILARIARARGAERIVATDVDPVAIESARLHCAFDPSQTPIKVSGELPDHWGPRFDLVVANILEGPLRSLAPHLSRALAPNGVLLLSGFTPGQTHALRMTFVLAGLDYVSEAMLEGWALLSFERPS
jgi:ribosomal protein L11 methyltransferase